MSHPDNNTHISTYRLFLRIWRHFLSPYKGHLLLSIYFMILAAAGEAMTIRMLQPIVDKVFVEKNAALLIPISLVVLLVFFVRSMAGYGQNGLLAMVGLKIVADMQDKLFRHLSGMDVPYFMQQASGRLTARFTVDTVMIRNAVSSTLTGMGRDILTVLFLFILMYRQDPQLTLIVLGVFPIAFYPIILLGKRMRRVTVDTQEETGHLNALLDDVFQGIRTVKAFGLESREQERAHGRIDSIFSLAFSAIRTRALARPMTEFLGGVAVCVIILYGGNNVIEGRMTPGGFFTFIGALLSVYRPLKALSNMNTALQEGLAGAARLFAVLDTPPAIADKKDATALTCTDGEIRFDQVQFAYDGSASPLLQDFSLTLPPGKTTALVGSSGAGKSTLINLILRFFVSSKGRILIDGTDTDSITHASLMDHLSLVTQDVTLFDGSIYDNIAIGNPNAPKNAVIKAAKKADADSFIRALPNGYETRTGENGLTLSGGQRQRIAIARALLKDAPILLLDEATSALDSKTEKSIQKALKNASKGRTTLTIAHRLSTIADADIIHVMEKGSIVESGTHTDLMAQNGRYAELYALQQSEKGSAAV